MPIDKTKLQSVDQVYPLKVAPYEEYMTVTENPSVVAKLNAMLQSLHQIGRLTNQTVAQWNRVMDWIVNGGMDDIALKVTTEKVEAALKEAMEMLDLSLDNGLKELAENVTDTKISELLASGQFESMISESLVEINQVVEEKLTGFAGLLADMSALEINLKTYDLKADGTDQTAKISQAIEDAPIGSKLVFPKGDYIGLLNLTKPLTIDFNGAKVTPPNGTDKIFNAVGVQSVNNFILSAPVKRLDRVLELTTTDVDIVTGDLIVLTDDSTRATDGAGKVNQEVHEVLQVGLGKITLKDFVRLPKSVASVNVYKITPIEGIVIENINLEGATGAIGNHGLFFDMCKDVTIKTFSMTKSVAPCITFRRSFNCLVDGFIVSKPQGVGSGQGVAVQATQGTSRLTILNGTVKDMRITVDCGNSFDVFGQNISSYNNVGVPYSLSHNGWDADITFDQCTSYGGTSNPFHFSTQGVIDGFSLRAYNINVRNSKAYVEDATDAIGIYSSAPLIGCTFENIEIVCGKGNTSLNTNYGIRIPAVDNKDTVFRNVHLKGFSRGAYQYTAGGTRPALNELDMVRYENVTIENAAYGIYGLYTNAIHVKGAKFKNVSINVFYIHATSSSQKLRHLMLEDIVIQEYVPGTLIQFSEAARHTNGVLGNIGNIHANTTAKTNLSVTAGVQLTLEEMLLNKNGGLIRLAASPTTSLGVEPFAKGLVEGQEMTLVSVGLDVTIPDGENNINNSVAPLVLGSIKRGVKYIWSDSTWVQVS